MKLTAFPESFLRCMSAEDRKALGQMTPSEAQERYSRGREKELKALVVNWLNSQGCWIFEQGMHRKTGGRCGTPDILVCAPPTGRFLAIELKVADSRLELAQATEIERIRTAGGCAIVARCLNDVMEGLWKARKASYHTPTTKKLPQCNPLIRYRRRSSRLRGAPAVKLMTPVKFPSFARAASTNCASDKNSARRRTSTWHPLGLGRSPTRARWRPGWLRCSRSENNVASPLKKSWRELEYVVA